jgi:single-strand DNA-binding protein
LVRDPELRETQSGLQVANMRLAVDRRRDRGQADFLDVVAWRQTAEFAGKFFRKGMRIGVSGAVQSREWEDRDGNRRVSVEIVADSLHFADGGQDEARAARGKGQGDEDGLAPLGGEGEEGIPF